MPPGPAPTAPLRGALPGLSRSATSGSGRLVCDSPRRYGSVGSDLVPRGRLRFFRGILDRFVDLLRDELVLGLDVDRGFLGREPDVDRVVQSFDCLVAVGFGVGRAAVAARHGSRVSGVGGADGLAAFGRLPHELAVGSLDPLAFGVSAARFFFRELRLALDVHAPAGQARREPRVLTFLADRERQLKVGNDDFGDTGLVVNANLPHLRGRERAHHELLRFVAVGNDVDLLTAQLVHDLTHAHATRTDARTDRVDVLVVRRDGQLRAVPRLARDGLDLDDAVDELGNFELEEALHQSGVRA